MFGPPTGGDGSPPRVWGLHVSTEAKIGRLRFTPTRVGTAARRRLPSSTTSVHPHACGDCLFKSTSVFSNFGSPPRVWGLLSTQQSAASVARFTPTRVGTAGLPDRLRRTPEVHPHACGDCRRARSAAPSAPGSPPRVWGLLCAPSCSVRWRRFTPTRVGTALVLALWAWLRKVHPHACGDCPMEIIATDAFAGSPPRVWGLLAPLAEPDLPVRFTPTRVGTARTATASRVTLSVHPHACGDCSRTLRPSFAAIGSPPRVWGLLKLNAKAQVEEGSPPRVWGLHVQIRLAETGRRFTPTRVGTACPCQQSGDLL